MPLYLSRLALRPRAGVRASAMILATVMALVGSVVAAVPATPAGALPLGGPASVAAAKPDACSQVVPGVAHGAEAVEQAGPRLAQIAARHGVPTPVLEARLLADETLWIDECGALFYVEPAAEPPPTGPSEAEAPAGSSMAALAPGEALHLHSRPGANRVIHLDFDGRVIASTGWNDGYSGGASFTAVAYDTDGLPGTFSAAEEAFIGEAWARVAEDYAAFDVDVTTEDPGVAAIDRTSTSDGAYGTTAVITRGGPVSARCSCGGIAYVGVFDWTPDHQYYQPALAFVESWYSAKDAAEIVSHEVGHNLGLSHDGNASTEYYDGQGAWAPLMGVGYYRPLTQWSRGEYAGANNTEDDFAVMASHGAPLRGDDHGDTRSAATNLGGGGSFAGSGLIRNRADVDWFAFSGSGATTVRVSPADSGADLDVRIELYNASGALVAASDPPAAMVDASTVTGLDASLSLTLPAPGVYSLRVDGVGFGDSASGYSDYGSVGQYRVTVTTVPPPAAAQISSFTPSSGTAGTEVTINGSGFASATSVTLGGAAAAFTIVSDTSIRATLATAATTGPVAVTTPGGTTTSAASFTVRPSISGIAPASGVTGTSVTITGSGLNGATSVRFNGASASFASASSTRITATVPASGTSGPVVVVTPAGTATGPTFTVTPVVTSFTPTVGAIGTQVTINGSGLNAPSGVRFNGLNAGFTQLSSTQIRAVVPTGATSGPISVVTAAGTATSTGSFSVSFAPTISSFSPASGAARTEVTIVGTNFSGATAVRLNGISMKYAVVSATRISATVPANASSGPITVTTPLGTATSSTSFIVDRARAR
jgi:hypothetical protein